ncbi:glutamyl-tRNA reductase [Aliivibrio sifiae]|uniref:Glutamyl-tRNA reductase n=1 Tax=Aliivibrio sifiae TaxID=566293 RepID=A0A2S7XKV1_9GAMM|nr:glutamyl-tRNA reductase [Aliivibrio sifiae]PQJ94031.1 glutamyl-tRNA reductase [Aliivibrio sifiae]GLR75477.1 glutamyl-tRNA reductase [Aliivibrio sifiae]
MSLLVIGINHTSASVDLREKVAFSPDKLTKALDELKNSDAIQSGVILSTCNRTEIYCEVKVGISSGYVLNWLAEFHRVSLDILMPSIYVYEEQAAVKHLMRVSCGLDSLVLGEPQILGQVKKAFADAREHNAVEGIIEKLFQSDFSVAKRVRTETNIGGNAVSVAYAACILARQIFESLAESTVLLVGAGETIELVAKHLDAAGCKQLIVANRTRERAMGLAEQFNADVISLPEIPEYLPKADIIISSTASPLPIIGKGMVESALKQRRHQPMLFVDIAVPRDIEGEVAELNDAYLYSVDDLKSIIDHNIEQRKIEAIQAEAIVSEESASFMTWIRSRQAVNSIRQYRNNSEAIRTELLQKSIQALASGQNAEKVLAELSNKLTNKLIHAPTLAMQQAAKNGEPDKLAVIRTSIGLDN